MAVDPKIRAKAIRDFEEQAEELVVFQLDLLAHLEQQLRAAHHLMRDIEKLRSVKKRVGPELSNGERGDTLSHLDSELDALDIQVRTQRHLCSDMHQTINQMQTKLEHVRQITRRSTSPSERSQRLNLVGAWVRR